MMGQLTVFENLLFSARFRLPARCTREQRLLMVERAIAVLQGGGRGGAGRGAGTACLAQQASRLAAGCAHPQLLAHMCMARCADTSWPTPAARSWRMCATR